MRLPVLLNWKASNTFGWGLLGLGLDLHWASDPDIRPLMGFPMGPNDFPGLDAVRAMALRQVVPESNEFLAQLKAGKVNLRQRGVLVMDALSNGLLGPNLGHVGAHNVGRCVFEDTRLGEVDARLAKYDSLLCASRWNADLLSAASTKPVTMIHEGVDHSQFFPGPRSGFLGTGRFHVFSGGKIEFRKAHDLVLLAFREFASRHDDAVLVGAWHSPWPQVSAGFRGKLPMALGQNAQGGLEIARWVAENGIRPHQFIEVPAMPNSMLPSLLREMDCAVQVSRCEPCTNLPAMEAMACGIPVILADNTGMKDLIGQGNCVALHSQGAVVGHSECGTEGWRESSIDEIVSALEMLYTDSQRRCHIGARGAEWILEQRRTWRDHAADLKQYLLGLSHRS
jgi:glycosyltransferase involved in cell wall biosynthesis